MIPREENTARSCPNGLFPRPPVKRLPIVQGLFKELTILGFLSVVTFVTSKLELLDSLSKHVFGDSEQREQYLEELLETVHMSIFGVMLVLIVQVYSLMHIVKEQFSRWQKYQRVCSSDNERKAQDIDEICGWLEQEHISGHGSFLRPIYNYLTGRASRHRDLVELLVFDSFREEFISPRAQFPPFDRIVSEALPTNFDMAKYLSYQCRNFLVEAIEIPVATWGAIWTMSLVFSACMRICRDDPVTLAWIWSIGAGWTLMLLHRLFQKSLTWALSRCCNRKYCKRANLKAWFAEKEPERAALLAGSRQQEDAPGWTFLPLPDPHVRSAFDKFVKGNASRQQLLFLTGAQTHETNQYLARLFLLSFTIYTSLLVMQFLPTMLKKERSSTALLLFHVTALLPCIYYVRTLQNFITNIVLVNSLRVFKPAGVISTVLRDQKTERAMKAIVLLNGMRNQFSDAGAADSAGADEDAVKEVGPQQVKEIEASFDAFDTSGDGSIDSLELRDLMQSLGCSLSPAEAEEKLKILDEDNDGTISRDEVGSSLQLL